MKRDLFEIYTGVVSGMIDGAFSLVFAVVADLIVSYTFHVNFFNVNNIFLVAVVSLIAYSIICAVSNRETIGQVLTRN